MNEIVKSIHGLTDRNPIKGSNFLEINKTKTTIKQKTSKQTMMKQFAFAAIAALATAEMASKPQLVVSYQDNGNYFLGLEHGNPANLKMPRDWRARDGECSGWQLQDASMEYDSFSLELLSPPEGQKGCTKLILSAFDDAVDYEAESVVFTNDCGEEIETLIVNVQVYDDGESI